MQFLVTDECRRLGLVAGAIAFRDVHVQSRSPALEDAIRETARVVQARFKNPAETRPCPEVVAFRELLRQVGVNPRRDQPSVERLLSYAIKRGNLPAINSLVDSYNLVSIRTLCSLGAHDLDRIDMPVSLQLLTGQETFIPLGSDTPQSIRVGEFGYVDAGGRVLCRLDVMQSDFSKVTAPTRNVLLIVEGTAAHIPDHLRRAVEDAIALVIEQCGGTAEVLTWPS
jgi:DNA/RNA-binding domain of Phe-tRNA-synthetase-like protein